MVSDADVRTLAAKLKGLHALLGPGEHLLLQEVLRRAAPGDHDDEDTTGHVWAVSFNPLPCLDAIAGRAGDSGEG
jgi:hypothetical protein